jgi:RNA polymerase sigma factor (sigma-70 family)
LQRRSRLAAWVAREVMPHEPSVRAWLSRAGLAREDIDDVIQDSYCNFSGLDAHEHIERPEGYFFQTVRHLVIRRAARQKIVPFVPIVDEDYRDQQPGPDRDAGARIELERVMALLAGLPERRRRIFTMRRIEGMSQRAIAEAMAVSENIVEHETRQALAELKRAWEGSSQAEGETLAAQPRERRA